MVNSSYQRSITIKKKPEISKVIRIIKNYNYSINYDRSGLGRNLFGDFIKILDSLQLKLMFSRKFVQQKESGCQPEYCTHEH